MTADKEREGSMPGAGAVPSRNWVPSHIGEEIRKRWSEG